MHLLKSCGGTVPPAALVAGRCLVEFSNKSQASTFPDMSLYQKDGATKANNGALKGDSSGQGFFTISTPGTKAVVGLAQDKPFKLGSVHVQLACPYASLFITEVERKADLSTTKCALISAIARGANTGFSYSTINGQILDNGKGPTLMEPVKATT